MLTGEVRRAAEGGCEGVKNGKQGKTGGKERRWKEKDRENDKFEWIGRYKEEK